MKQFHFVCLVFFLASIIITSCNPLKKNVNTDIADDVVEFIISESNGKYFLISQEEIFQATSKSDKQGIRQITGYSEFRISCYDLNSGNLISRVVLGDREENECDFLGESKNLLWYKSVNSELGFHARDPKTLEVLITQERIADINPFLKGNFSQPEWNSIKKYYGFDINKQLPMISDNSGFLYYIDPVTLKAEKTNESVKNYEFGNACLASTMILKKNSYLFLKGNPRNYIEYGKNEFKDISFLKGEFIKSSVQINPESTDIEFLESYNKEINDFRRQIDSLKKILSGIDTNDKSDKNRFINQSKKNSAERNIKSLEMRIKYAGDIRQNESVLENFSLITPDRCIFIYSQTDVTDQSKVLISKVKIISDSSVDLVWQTRLDNIFADPVKGLDRSSFETVFSKGSPDLNTKRVVMGNGKLVIMSMLRAVCIDIEGGKVLWEKEL